MRPASARLRHTVLAAGAATAATVLSPLLPLVAADDGGLGPGGASFAFNYTLIVGILLAFIFGFGLRDYIQKRMLRARSAKKPTSAPPRT